MTGFATPDTILTQYEVESECVIWTGYIRPNGYGAVGRNLMAHRVAWKTTHGAIPEGLTIDHLCSTRACVNIDHMEVVTRGENAARAQRAKTHCKWGHPFDEANTRISSVGKRVCRTCAREWMRSKRATKC